MNLQGVSTQRVSSITQALSRVKVSKDAFSRLTGKFDEEVARWCTRSIESRLSGTPQPASLKLLHRYFERRRH